MSEYIPRLREELVEAAAREHAGQRRRVGVRPHRVGIALAAAVMAVAVVLTVGAIEVANDERPAVSLPPGTALSYRVTTAPGADAGAAARRAADVLRARIGAAGISGATISVAGDRVGVDAAGADLAAIEALAVPGRLAIYDWEASVLGPDGRPAPGDASVTGGPAAGQAAAVSHYEAVIRASRAQGTQAPPAYWLVDDAARMVLAGPQWTRDALTGDDAAREGARVVEAPGGVRVVQGPAADRWYALGDRASLGNADVAGARVARDSLSNDPVVAVDFTPTGEDAFTALTREIARRGQTASRPGEEPTTAAQHLAIVLDDRIASVPFIDPRQAPDGIDGSQGAQIHGDLSSQRASQIATILDTGPMPASLTPLGAVAP